MRKRRRTPRTSATFTSRSKRVSTSCTTGAIAAAAARKRRPRGVPLRERGSVNRLRGEPERVRKYARSRSSAARIRAGSSAASRSSWARSRATSAKGPLSHGPSSSTRRNVVRIPPRRSARLATAPRHAPAAVESRGTPRSTRPSAAATAVRRWSRWVTANRTRHGPSCASSMATSGSSCAAALPVTSVRSTACATMCGTSVSSATAKPGSRSASSGNSRSSDRQKASMVLIVISPSRSRSSRQRASPARERAASCFNSSTIRSRISAAACRVKVIASTFSGAIPARNRFR